MPSGTTETTSLPKGTYAHSSGTDLRSPCPLINSLANHGYLPRDGRNIQSSDFEAALRQVGISRALGAVLSRPIYNEHVDPIDAAKQPPKSFLAKLWTILRNPWAILANFAMRPPGQTDARGRPVLHLDQLAVHNAVEHDVSLSRRDHAQGDNLHPQPDLIDALLAASSDGGKTLTMQDLCAHRRRRIAEQRVANPALDYHVPQHKAACGEIALILKVFGDGASVPCEYMRAIFAEERLPVKEGWTKRSWWSVGFWDLFQGGKNVGKMIGLKIE